MHEYFCHWMQKQLIGLSVKSWDEMLFAIAVGVNMVEIKIEKFAENGMPLYSYRNGKFRMNHVVLRKISSFAKEYDIEVQFHLPIERSADCSMETGINVGIRSHGIYGIRRAIMLEEIYRMYGFGQMITLHPPTRSFNGVVIDSDENLLENARIHYEELDRYRMSHDHQTFICLENQPKGKKIASCLGDDWEHFKTILLNTRTICITLDSGHRLLADRFTITEFLTISVPIRNFHFHGNEGIYSAENYDDDQHQLPTMKNVKRYDKYIIFFKRHRTPIVLELSHLEQYTQQYLREFIDNLKRETE